MAELRLGNSFRELSGMDGEHIEFEWNISPGFTLLQIIQKVQSDLFGKTIELEQFGQNRSHVHVRHRVDSERKRRKMFFEFRKCQSVQIKILARTLGIPRDYNYKPEGTWDSLASRILRDRTPSFHRGRCFESWNHEEGEQQRHHSLQW